MANYRPHQMRTFHRPGIHLLDRWSPLLGGFMLSAIGLENSLLPVTIAQVVAVLPPFSSPISWRWILNSGLVLPKWWLWWPQSPNWRPPLLSSHPQLPACARLSTFVVINLKVLGNGFKCKNMSTTSKKKFNKALAISSWLTLGHIITV